MTIAARACAVLCSTALVAMPIAGRTQILTSGDTVHRPGAEAQPQQPAPTASKTSNPRRPAYSTRLTSDATPGSQQQPNAPSKNSKAASCVAGAGVAGLLGMALTKALGGSSKQATRVGIAGAAIGCGLGMNWSERDRAAYDEASQDALDDPGNGSRDWYTPESRERVTFQTVSATTESRPVEFQYYSNVAAPVAGSRIISRPYRTTTTLRLRDLPDETNGVIVGRFDPGETVEVVGETPDRRWAMIGEGGVIVGYASMSYLTPLGSQSVRKTVTARAKADAPARVAKGKAAPAPTAPSRGALQTTKVVASTQCKSLVATSGDQTDQRKGCNLPNGKWQFA